MQAMKIKDVTSNLISIHSFFSIYTNYQAVKLLRSVFIVSCEPGQILKNKNPSELLFFSYLLDNLIEEVFGIVSNPVRMIKICGGWINIIPTVGMIIYVLHGIIFHGIYLKRNFCSR